MAVRPEFRDRLGIAARNIHEHASEVIDLVFVEEQRAACNRGESSSNNARELDTVMVGEGVAFQFDGYSVPIGFDRAGIV